jgi:DNA-directed RNA polymerase specialized sigma24 family protein
LSQIEQGDSQAAENLLPLVYEELRKLAAVKLSSEQSGQTLQATALVHEAYLRLVGKANDAHWQGRGHFFAAAAEAMRRILVERFRRKRAVRHGGNRQQVPLDRLAAADPAVAELVKLRYFAGMTIEEAATILAFPPERPMTIGLTPRHG